MWLDRFAGQQIGTPPPSSSRSSPLPRRTSSGISPYTTSQRPGISPRGSSLSLVSNDSSASSLLASSKRANGSALKQSTTVEDAADPEEVLTRIFGPLSDGSRDGSLEEESLVRITEDDLELEFDFGGLALRELAEGDAVERQAADTCRPQTVEDCMFSQAHKACYFCTHSFELVERDKAKFEELHRSIRACDDILNSVETNLTSFRNDLAAVSADIESLQARSTALNVRLENRKAVEKALGPIVEELSVSPMVVSKIADGHIDEAWVKVLAELDKRATAQKKGSQQSPQSKALADIGPLLEKLVHKVISIHPQLGLCLAILIRTRPLSGSETSL